MKSLTKDQSHLIVVNPAARGCGTAEPTEEKSNVDLLVEQARNTDEFLAISDRILGFANLVDQEMAKLTESVSGNDAAGLEKCAQRIANAASEVGASNLIRSCYQLLITV